MHRHLQRFVPIFTILLMISIAMGNIVQAAPLCPP